MRLRLRKVGIKLIRVKFQDVLSVSKEKENEFPKPQLRQVKSVEGGKISDRLEEIKKNSEKWKNRIGELIRDKFSDKFSIFIENFYQNLNFS